VYPTIDGGACNANGNARHCAAFCEDSRWTRRIHISVSFMRSSRERRRVRRTVFMACYLAAMVGFVDVRAGWLAAVVVLVASRQGGAVDTT
jgi:hypothetical protein